MRRVLGQLQRLGFTWSHALGSEFDAIRHESEATPQTFMSFYWVHVRWPEPPDKARGTSYRRVASPAVVNFVELDGMLGGVEVPKTALETF